MSFYSKKKSFHGFLRSNLTRPGCDIPKPIIAMKKNITLFSTTIFCIVLATSCTKQPSSSSGNDPSAGRTIRFHLYTNRDFSNDHGIIHFSVIIRNGSALLFDSTLAVMQIKDIPDSAHKIIIDKKISGYDNADLSAGFLYEIENVGYSWFIDTSKAGNPLKVVDYAFQ